MPPEVEEDGPEEEEQAGNIVEEADEDEADGEWEGDEEARCRSPAREGAWSGLIGPLNPDSL